MENDIINLLLFGISFIGGFYIGRMIGMFLKKIYQLIKGVRNENR